MPFRVNRRYLRYARPFPQVSAAKNGHQMPILAMMAQRNNPMFPIRLVGVSRYTTMGRPTQQQSTDTRAWTRDDVTNSHSRLRPWTARLTVGLVGSLMPGSSHREC